MTKRKKNYRQKGLDEINIILGRDNIKKKLYRKKTILKSEANKNRNRKEMK